MGLTWAFAWSLVGTIPRWILGYNPDAPFPIILGVLGFIGGIAFSGVLMLAERRHRLDQVTLRRFAGWGAVGGLVLSGVFAKIASLSAANLLLVAPTLAAACAVCASGSLAVARRAEKLSLSGGDQIGERHLRDSGQRAIDTGRE